MSLYSHEASSRECLLPPNAATTSEGAYATMGAPDELETGTTETSTQHVEVDAATARRIVRRIDMRLMPLLFVTYVFNFMDKTILSSASVFGLKQDTHRQNPRRIFALSHSQCSHRW